MEANPAGELLWRFLAERAGETAFVSKKKTFPRISVCAYHLARPQRLIPLCS
jgi:hypothetical protein